MYKIIDIFGHNKIFQSFAFFRLSANVAPVWLVDRGDIADWVFSQIRQEGKEGWGVLFSCDLVSM